MFLVPNVAKIVAPSFISKGITPITKNAQLVSNLKRSFHASTIVKNRKSGIVGLPNVGKSALFNALVGREVAESSNRPFTTIDPNSSVVRVPDSRLDKLAEVAESAKITQATIDFIDIAGLVSGASEGKGLGNKFLANIAAVHSIVHLVRCFEDDTITHVEGKPDPIRDIQIIEQELIYKDLSSMEGFIRRKPKHNTPETQMMDKVMQKTMEVLENDKLAIDVLPKLANEHEVELFNSWKLLSAKPVLICCNVDENHASKGNHLSDSVVEWSKSQGHSVSPVIVSAKLESELMILEEDPERRKELFLSYGLEESALSTIIRSSYQLLNLITYYTAGPTESRAWSVMKGSNAKECAAEIHTDISRGFIKAETFNYNDYITLGEKKCRDTNKMRLEGPSYIAQDGDIFLFKFKAPK